MWVNKYNSKKVTIDGYTFDSAKEARRYSNLVLMQKAGIISGLTLQPAFELQEKYKKNGRSVREIKYIADFSYLENGKLVIEDVKAADNFKTDVYKLKKKLFEFKYPELEIREIY
jgi:hypothetical protein